MRGIPGGNRVNETKLEDNSPSLAPQVQEIRGPELDRATFVQVRERTSELNAQICQEQSNASRVDEVTRLGDVRGTFARASVAGKTTFGMSPKQPISVPRRTFALETKTFSGGDVA
ncbi:MAG: hypothetical protein U1A77_25335 [Pirellulales bacterium]